MSNLATDSHTINTQMICRMASIHRGTVNQAVHVGLIAAGRRRRGVRGVWWSAADANKFLRRRGHLGPWFAE